MPARWRDVTRDLGNNVYRSVVSLWEAVIKHNLGKLELPEPPESYIPTQQSKKHNCNLKIGVVKESVFPSTE